MLTKPDFNEKKIIIVIPKNGEILSFKNDNIIIKDINNKIKFQLSCYRLFAIYIIGGFTITTGLIERSKKFGFSILLFTVNFKLYEIINFELEGNTLLRKKQYLNDNKVKIGKYIIINKINNQIVAVNTLRNKKDLEYTLKLSEYITRLLENDMSYAEIMGIEGIASKMYFKRIFNNLEWKRSST